MKWLTIIILNLLFVFSAAAANRVSFKTNFCVCKDKRAVSYGSCASICADKETNGSEILFANFNFRPNFKYSNTKEWCTKGKLTNRRCVIRATDVNGQHYEMDATLTGKNSVSAHVDMLNFDQAYVLQLVEQTTRNKSDAVQLIKFQ